jgi:site-specific recombinase XerD
MTATALTTIRTQAGDLTTTELTARDVFNIWLADQSELTQAVYKAEVTAFLDWAGKPAQGVHIGDVVSYKRALADGGLAPATIAKKLSAIRSFYKVCHAQGLTPTNPTAGVKLPKVRDETSKDILSLAEVQKLFAQVDTSTALGLRDRAVLALLVINGLREVEIARANYGDLKEVDGIKVLVVHGKGGREDETVLRDDVHQALTAYLETRGDLKPSSPLFIGANHRAGKRISTRTVRYRIDHYLERAGLKREGISGHSLRHTAITWPILAGASLVQAMELARHADPRTTKRYFHNLDKLRGHAVNLSPITIAV